MAAILLPFRSSWPNTNVAMILVAVVVAVAVIGNRVAGALAAVWAAIWFDFFEYGSLVGQPPRLEQDGTVTAGRAGHGRLDVEQAGLPAGDIELRVFGNGQYYGRFMMTAKPGSRPSLQARLVAVTLADQAGRALAAPAASRRIR